MLSFLFLQILYLTGQLLGPRQILVHSMKLIFDFFLSFNFASDIDQDIWRSRSLEFENWSVTEMNKNTI